MSQQSKWHLSHGNYGNFEGVSKRYEIQEAYKDYDKVTSDVRGSLVGALRTDFSARQLNHVDPKDLKLYNRFWDLTKNDDFAPEMENSFFVPTNVFITTNQKRGKCSEWDQTKSSCRRDKDCKSTSTLYAINNHGVRTGKCMSETRSSTQKSCEVRRHFFATLLFLPLLSPR